MEWFLHGTAKKMKNRKDKDEKEKVDCSLIADGVMCVH